MESLVQVQFSQLYLNIQASFEICKIEICSNSIYLQLDPKMHTNATIKWNHSILFDKSIPTSERLNRATNTVNVEHILYPLENFSISEVLNSN